MATSGSVDFSVSRDDIINEALQICGVVAEGGTANTNQLADASRTLNMWVKHIQTKTTNLWAIQQGIIFPEANKVKYKLGGSGSDHSCLVSDLVQTTVRVAYVSGTTLDVVSTTGMTTGDNIGVVLDTGVLEWRTLTVVDVDTVTLSGALSGPAAIGNTVYTYTSKIPRPLRIISAFSRDIRGPLDTEIIIISKQEYDNLSSKNTTASVVNQLYYDPQIDQGLAYVWPEPTDMQSLIYIRYTRPLEDFDAGANTPDFPQEWYLPISWNLASLLCVKYGVPSATVQLIYGNARMFLEDALDFDVEGNTSIFISPRESHSA